MYNKILIFTDNLYLAEKFLNTINSLNSIEWSFAISPNSNKDLFLEILKSNPKVYNLKDELVIDEIIKNHDMVLSLHCKQLFPKKMVKNIKCINIHPGYNPINRGWYPQVFAIVNNLPIGATIHEIDEDLDNGPIIVREFVNKSNLDTSEMLYNKIVELEFKLLEEHIGSIINNTYSTFLPENNGNLYFKKDFNNLCELNLEETTSTEQIINRLRALTHGGHKNAYYVDSKTNKKVYISINLEQE